MVSANTERNESTPRKRASTAHRLALALVWLTIAASAVVFNEPAPVDVLMLRLIVLLPVAGLVRFTPGILALFGAWLAIGALALLASSWAILPDRALVHAGVTIFLAFGFLVTAAFVMRAPVRHARLLMHAYVVSAVIASAIAIVGYFDALPGSAELFTRYGRASATFKDPNVFGAFLVLPAAFLLGEILSSPIRRAILLSPWAGLIIVAALLSFSRGAWLNLVIALAIVVYLAVLTAPTNRQRLFAFTAATVAICAATVLVVGALSIDAVEDLFLDRASLDQGYDKGPEGRFGGQQKARNLIIENPFGIAPQQFAPHYHIEEPHNVYLALFLNSGWLGGLIHLMFTLVTLVWALPYCFRRGPLQGLFIAAYAAFVGHVVEGYVIDLDHWRHYHLILALLWGVMLSGHLVSARSAVGLGPPAPHPMVAATRPARPLLPAPPRVVLALPAPRRERGREDSRPSRAAGRTFSQHRS
jgi:O-antigen ligase